MRLSGMALCSLLLSALPQPIYADDQQEKYLGVQVFPGSVASNRRRVAHARSKLAFATSPVSKARHLSWNALVGFNDMVCDSSWDAPCSMFGLSGGTMACSRVAIYFPRWHHAGVWMSRAIELGEGEDMIDRTPALLQIAALALVVLATGFALRAAWESPPAVEAQEITSLTPTTSTATASPTPTTTSTTPATASPSPSSPSPSDRMLESGGPAAGPVPLMPGGECPSEYPVLKNGACFTGGQGDDRNRK